jgi:hypothetical protein
VVFAIALLVLITTLVVSGCNIDFGIGEEPPEPAAPVIVAPANQTQVLVGGPVQVESLYPNSNLSRVELYVQGPGSTAERLIRADVPTAEGYVLQEWTPEQPGQYVVRTLAYPQNSAQPLAPLTIQLEALEGIVASGGVGAEIFQPPTVTPVPPTPTPEVIVVVATPANIIPTPTPPLEYPPPPPIPGVPKGPTQDQLPLKMPPVCDAAEYLGVFTADTGRRIFIPTDDQIAARVVGGATVHRAWRLRNIGTCTWGPGYELAFYGGRAMGSGGIAFEAAYPADPGRRNALVSNERLIVPEGKPNQVAILELLLNVPSVPGIHQSYWRMRNPQGVYFGPIIGVTLEVVRDCKPEPGGPVIYGAPIINQFEILGVGDVFEPDTPTNVLAEFGDTVTLEWNVINATNFDIVLENPLGNISALSNTATQGRAQFIASELGRYIITIYADNGPCAYTDQVTVTVVPRDQDLFELDIILSPTSAVAAAGQEDVQVSETLDVGQIAAEWQHIDPEVDRFILLAELYRRERRRECLTVPWLEWQLPVCPTEETWVPTGVTQTVDVSNAVDVRDDVLGAQGAANISNLESTLCGSRTPAEDYFIRYQMRAEKEGQPATPARSNTVDVRCVADTLRTEIQNRPSVDEVDNSNDNIDN